VGNLKGKGTKARHECQSRRVEVIVRKEKIGVKQGIDEKITGRRVVPRSEHKKKGVLRDLIREKGKSSRS